MASVFELIGYPHPEHKEQEAYGNTQGS